MHAFAICGPRVALSVCVRVPDKSAMTRKPGAPRRVAVRIMSYFLRNPGAADDLYGIACFRLPDQVIYQHVTEVSDALEWLVSNGWLRKVRAASSTPMFTLNTAARRDAEQFVADAVRRKRRTRAGKGPTCQ